MNGTVVGVASRFRELFRVPGNLATETHMEQETGGTARGGRMLSRTWTIAAQFNEPSDYGVPEVPDLVVGIDAADRVVFADPDTGEPFLRAEEPMQVRR